LPLGGRVRRRLTLEYASRDELLACLDHLLDAAGNPSLMTTELKATLADHAAGNYRVLMNLSDELLTLALNRELPRLDEKLYLERLLTAAPELATLALLETALTVCTSALLAEHPTLGHDLCPDPEPPSLRETRRLPAAAHRLRGTLSRYRSAVIDGLVPPRDDTDPF
jgi:hypothetical protein